MKKKKCFSESGIIVPCFPPSINHSHGYVSGKVYLKKDVLDFRSKFSMTSASLFFKKKLEDMRKIVEDNEKLSLELKFFYPWKTDKGKIRRIDVSNRVKILEDAVSEVLKFDDSRVYEIHVEKCSGKDISFFSDDGDKARGVGFLVKAYE